MSRIPISWKLFIIFNYLLLLSFLLIFTGLCFFLGNNRVEPEGLITFIPFFTGSFLIMLNALFMIIHYHRHFPDKPFKKSTRIFYLIHTGCYFLAILALLFLVILGFTEETSNQQNDNTGLILLGVLSLLLGLCIYTFVYQLKLKKTLEHNYENSVEMMINQLGKDQ